ncbi:MAG: glutamate--tRNA ligase, partial [Proteobacteria bacterium]|nr:glutamate--tRNA ligase [Pseudomonadota bacterium]
EELAGLRERQMASGDHIRYDGRCRERTGPRDGVPPVVRFRNPDAGEVIVDDVVRGRVVFENSQLDDLIIARSDGSPTYNFCVIIDDFDMRITHVVRGDDHLNNTPRQMNMLAALGAEPPTYAHLPMILGPDGARLSKRHGAVDIRDYRERGYLPGAMLNYLVRLGWSFGDRETFSVDEMIERFDIADVNQSASAFNPEKLRWLNQQHIIGADAAGLATALEPFLERAGYDLRSGPTPAAVAEAFRERAETLEQMAESARWSYEDFEEIDPKAAKKNLRPAVLEPLRAVTGRLAALTNWEKSDIEAAIRSVASDFELKLGKIGQPVRVAVTGGPVSPPIDVTLELIGQSRAVRRLEEALGLIAARASSNA